ncbi:NUDIX hydrolase [Lachnoclostridium sp.]|nr:NUDIX hydrolase [Lachnoclostridium sp.]
MSAFISDISNFLGNGKCNEEGKYLEKFLMEYDPNKYQNPSVTADILVFQKPENIYDLHKDLKLLLIQRKNHPCIGWWALPGGFVEIHEDIDKAAARELLEETGLSDIPMEQIYTFGKQDRDPRTRIVTVAYLALLESNQKVEAGDDAAEAEWFSVSIKKEFEELLEEDNIIVKHKRKRERYHIEVICEKNHDIKAEASVDYFCNVDTLLLQEDYEVIRSNGIAFDHPVFILRACQLLWKRM